VITLSVLINLFSCFEYSMQYKSSYSSKISIRIPFDFFKINLSSLNYYVLISLQYVKIVLSDLLFFLLIILIDILTIRFIIKKERNITSSNKKNSKRRLILNLLF